MTHLHGKPGTAAITWASPQGSGLNLGLGAPPGAPPCPPCRILRPARRLWPQFWCFLSSMNSPCFRTSRVLVSPSTLTSLAPGSQHLTRLSTTKTCHLHSQMALSYENKYTNKQKKKLTSSLNKWNTVSPLTDPTSTRQSPLRIQQWQETHVEWNQTKPQPGQGGRLSHKLEFNVMHFLCFQLLRSFPLGCTQRSTSKQFDPAINFAVNAYSMPTGCRLQVPSSGKHLDPPYRQAVRT